MMDLLKAGLDVFAKKPLGIGPQQTREWARAADENDYITCAGFQRRFHPVSQYAHKTIEGCSFAGYALATFHKDEIGASH